MCLLAGDSIQPEYIANVRDPETGDWEQSRSPLSKDLDHEPSTDLEYLTKHTGYEREGFSAALDNFSHVTFQDALNHIAPGYRITAAGRENRCPTPGDIVAPEGQGEYAMMNVADLMGIGNTGSTLAGDWGAVQDELIRVTQTFNEALDSLQNDKEHWDGKTKLKAFENVRQSFVAPDNISSAAGGMEILVDAFVRTVDYVYKNIEGNRPNYEYNVMLTRDEDHDEYINEFNEFARHVLGGPYTDNIQSIASNNPKITAGELPDLNPKPDDDNGSPVRGQGLGLGDGLGGGGPVPLGGGPSLPDLGDTKLPDGPSLPTKPPSDLDGLPSPEGLGDATQAANAAPAGLGSPAGGPSPMANAKDPREGALGLGPRGLNGPLKKSGGAGAGGGGAGRGPLGAKPLGKPSAVPAAAKATVARATPGAGLSSGAGTPGMMPPPAGQRGGDPNNKGHQTLKALRRKKTGEQVMGKADAVVPVVGETERPEPARPEPEEAPPERRRIADPPVTRTATGDVRQVP